MTASSSLRHVSAMVPPVPVVDSNGAGDAFACAFLYERPAGRNLEQCAPLGAAAGARACTAEGMHTALIDATALAACHSPGQGGPGIGDNRDGRPVAARSSDQGALHVRWRRAAEIACVPPRCRERL